MRKSLAEAKPETSEEFQRWLQKNGLRLEEAEGTARGGELSDEELGAVAGGSWFTDIFSDAMTYVVDNVAIPIVTEIFPFTETIVDQITDTGNGGNTTDAKTKR